MYVEFTKNFHLACWNKVMAVRLNSASWAEKRLIASFYTCSASSSWKIFLLPIRTSQWLLDSFRPPERKSVYSYFLNMMYVEFMKNFLLLDSSELLAVRLILAFWAKNRLIPTFQRWCTSSSGKIFFWRFERADGGWTNFGLLSPKTFDSYFLDMIYVEFMKNFLLADSSELMAVRLISASWVQKCLIPTF